MSITKDLTCEDIQAIMQNHWGSEQFFRHPLMSKLIYTEGIVDVANKAGMHWMVDMVASYIPAIYKNNLKLDDWFNLVRISVKDDSTASFSIKHDKGENAFVRQQIPYTDLPVGSYEFYLIYDGTYYTLLLKSEY